MTSARNGASEAQGHSIDAPASHEIGINDPTQSKMRGLNELLLSADWRAVAVCTAYRFPDGVVGVGGSAIIVGDVIETIAA
jgi:hypothetical protein